MWELYIGAFVELLADSSEHQGKRVRSLLMLRIYSPGVRFTKPSQVKMSPEYCFLTVRTQYLIA